VTRKPPRAVWIAVIAVAACAVAWWLGGEVVRRTQAARLPATPDLSRSPDAVRRAIEVSERAARADPATAGTVGELGMTYQANVANEAAMQAYALAERLSAGDWRWTYYRGLLFEERGDHDAALAAFTDVVTRAPQQGHAWFRIAEMRFKRGEVDEAARAYRRARDAPAAPVTPIDGVARAAGVPLAAYASLGLARVAFERGDATAADRELDALVAAHPSFGPARVWRAQRRYASTTGEPRAAVAGSYVPPVDPLVDAMVARSMHTDVLLKHATVAGRGGDPAWREHLARRALEANPQGLDVLLEMATFLKDTGRLTDALAFLQRARAIAPDDHHLLVEEGQVLGDLGRLGEAETVLRKAVAFRDAAAEYNLALVIDRQGRWEEARTHYERTLTINPFHTRAMNNMSVGLDRRGATTAALALYLRALAIVPDDPEVLSNYGSALISVKRFGDAVVVLEKAVALDPSSPNAHNNLGIALAQSGRLVEAVVEFRETLRLDPRHNNARANLAAVSRAARP
jgi:Flp pilus assembly protein TadD